MTKRLLHLILILTIFCCEQRTAFSQNKLENGYYFDQKKFPSIALSLYSDSTFSLEYSAQPSGYKTCGTFFVKVDTLYLVDFQDAEAIRYIVDCNLKKVSLIDTTGGLPLRRNLWTIFDKKGILKLQIKKKQLYWSEKNIMLIKKIEKDFLSLYSTIIP